MDDLIQTPTRFRGAAWLTSVILHAAGIFVLLTLHFTGADRALAARVRSVTLIAPQLKPAPIVRVQTKPHATIVPPREFHATLTAPPAARERVVIEAAPMPATIAPAPEIPVILATPAAPLIPEPKIAVKAAGFATAETSAAGPARGAITNTGMFGATAIGDGPAASGRKTSSAGFGDTVVATNSGTARKPTGPAAFSPVEILSKPRPQYTEDARRKQIEGEVLLEILFGAGGEARVMRVVRGLGHGLDESAMAAAREIRFKPAQRDGGAVDSAAVVHIVFQLAF